ncbi:MULTISPECIES: SDR family oxidoreductase [unclassified Devosia]|uniref:SDR family NAD(P)-dependent oxidoreductase n=1 Tax=unclassified Devosia TaxID=196773 RepID=UPI000868B422|nr:MULTISPECIES: SDR family oxidoreductase [unclassified Devosia]MBN9360681.1 SDR family oxidoreductase [Devosia sp.]ODS87875.1 MAG: oxidoreductase [Devosia sp. SCN 66-27]OJX22651.1 MAG: oxidoreductase [Devosia sp. 66-14]
MLEDIRGKRALVTGSSTGIGAAVARELARLGASVAVHGNKNAAAAEAVAAEISAAGGKAVVVLGDVSNSASAARIVADAVAGLGGLDILINNAGAILDRVTNAAFDDAAYDNVYNLNVRSVLAVTKAAYPHLKASGGGSIINTGSVAGRFGGFGGSAVYASAKAAVHSITRNAAREFAPDHIRVNVVAPGFIITPFHDKTPQAVKDSAAAQIPMQRLGTAEDCVGAYVFLASDSMSGYITGQIIDVNGGQLMP